MARVNGRMPGKHCRWGCCPIGDVDHKDQFMKDELALAQEELAQFPNELADDPDWDGKLSMWDLPEDVKYVKFIPAPKDDSGW